jgi:hypothetical protein
VGISKKELNPMNPKLKTLSLFLVGGGLLAGAFLFTPHAPKPPVVAVTPPTPTPIEPAKPQPSRPDAKPIVTNSKDERPLIQIALLLDNSGSMSGLIEQAKSQLWRMVNELAEAKKDGLQPRVELALYEYGERPMRIVDFTTELDKVSEALFSLTIRGGDEWCGRTIQTALEQLAWSKDPKAMKVIFIAGNEPFNQGDLDPTIAVRRATEQGVTVNTIYCGDLRSDESVAWKNGAILADGRFMSIDHNYRVVEVQAPQDQELAKLGVELNDTYIPYGTLGGSGSARQVAQDNNSSGYGLSNLSRRAVSKASSVYENSSWELVDGMKNKQVDLDNIQAEALPENMRGMSKEERSAYVKDKADKRTELQQRIRTLNAEREKFVQAQQQQQAPTSLDVAMVQAVRDQAQKHGFQFAN